MELVQILYDVIIPILAIILVGYFLHQKFQFDAQTLSKLMLYYFLPAVTFISIYESEINLSLGGQIIFYLIILFIALYVISYILGKIFRFDRSFTAVYTNSITLTNNGNIGIPLNRLVFQANPLAMSAQMILVTFEIIISYTIGVMNASSSQLKFKNSILAIFKLPVIYAVILACICKAFHFSLPSPLTSSLEMVSDGMIAFALFAIGTQVKFAAIRSHLLPLFLSIFGKLVIAPICAYLLIYLFHLHGMVAQTLLIASGIPTSRNSVALAMEYKNQPEFAAQSVIFSTLLSIITLPVLIYLAKTMIT